MVKHYDVACGRHHGRCQQDLRTHHPDPFRSRLYFAKVGRVGVGAHSPRLAWNANRPRLCVTALAINSCVYRHLTFCVSRMLHGVAYSPWTRDGDVVLDVGLQINVLDRFEVPWVSVLAHQFVLAGSSTLC